MQAKNLNIKGVEFSVIPVHIIHYLEKCNIHADINKIYRKD